MFVVEGPNLYQTRTPRLALRTQHPTNSLWEIAASQWRERAKPRNVKQTNDAPPNEQRTVKRCMQ